LFTVWAVTVALPAALASVAAADPGPESNRIHEQFFSEEEARDRVYGRGRQWETVQVPVDTAARMELYKATGLSEPDSLVRLVFGRDSTGAPVGAYRVASEVGKYLPFEFVVALDAGGRVHDVVVLNYRESRGGEVRRERFIAQYRGKSAASPVRLNRDILGIAGATLSAWAVNRGVKKTLWWHQRVGQQGGLP
jgi:Na+-translocating ferredoxin:NAD+ oxidoreductase RnfG subunit